MPRPYKRKRDFNYAVCPLLSPVGARHASPLQETEGLQLRRRVRAIPIPVEGRGQSLIELDPGRVSQRSELGDVGTAPRRAAGQQGRWRDGDLAPGDPRHALRQLGDGDLLRVADVIDAEMRAAVAHDHHARNQVIYVTEAARLLPAALDGKGRAAARSPCRELSQTQRELRYDRDRPPSSSFFVVRVKGLH